MEAVCELLIEMDLKGKRHGKLKKKTSVTSLEGMKKTTKFFPRADGVLGEIGKGTFRIDIRNFAA